MRITSALDWTLLVALLASPVVSSAQEPTDDQGPVALHNPVISSDGAWMAAEVPSDRGDGGVRVWSTEGDVTFSIERGQNPRISRDSRWVSTLQKPLFEDAMAAGSKNERAGQTLIVLDTQDGSRRTFDFVLSYDLTDSASHLVYLQSPETKVGEDEPSNDEATKPSNTPAVKGRRVGTLHVVHLEGDNTVIRAENVTEYASHQTRNLVAFVYPAEETGHDRLHIAAFSTGNWGTNGLYDGEKIEGLCWARDRRMLGFIDRRGTTGEDGKRRESRGLYTWQHGGFPGKVTRVDTPQ